MSLSLDKFVTVVKCIKCAFNFQLGSSVNAPIMTPFFVIAKSDLAIHQSSFTSHHSQRPINMCHRDSGRLTGDADPLFDARGSRRALPRDNEKGV